MKEFARADNDVGGEPGEDLSSGGDRDPACVSFGFGADIALLPCDSVTGVP